MFYAEHLKTELQSSLNTIMILRGNKKYTVFGFEYWTLRKWLRYIVSIDILSNV